MSSKNNILIQECIPVGCVPSAAVVAGEGRCIPACTGGVYPSMHWEGVVVVVSAPVHAGIHLSPVNRITDTCEI